MAYGLIVLIAVILAAAIFYARHKSHRQVYKRQRESERKREIKRDLEER